MQKITPNLWFDHDAEEAGAFYARVLPDTTSRVLMRYPDTGLPEFQQEFAGLPVVVDVIIRGFHVILINAGPEFPQNPSGSFTLRFLDADELDAVWNALAEGGQVTMELGAYPFSPRYGWLLDRYGVSWQLTVGDPSDAGLPFVTPSLLFAGAAQDRAREAIDFYVALFPDSEIELVAEYPDASGPAAAGAVQYAAFTLAGQQFAAMDSGAEGPFAFTPAFSLEVTCADQDEIDRYWQALSAVPEAEQCGWCVDRFGLSWQVTPADMNERLQHPGAYGRMLQMTKIVLAEL